MEALAALSLAGTVISLVDFSIKIVNVWYKVYKSGDGQPARGQDARALAEQLQSYLLDIKAKTHLQSIYSDDPGDGDDELAGLSDQATQIVEDLVAALDSVSIDGPKTKRASLKHVFNTIGLRSKIEPLEKRLSSLRADIQLYYLRELRNQACEQDIVARDNQLGLQETRECINQLTKEVRQLVQMNARKPPNIGYPWEANPAILLDDGLGAESWIPIEFISSSPEVGHAKAPLSSFADDSQYLRKILETKFRNLDLPGTDFVNMGYIEFLSADETQTLTNENWGNYVASRKTIKVSFVAGSFHGLSKGKCSRCFKPFRTLARLWQWRSCQSCNLKSRYVRPQSFPYEPPDIMFNPKAWRDFQLRKKINASSPKQSVEEDEPAEETTTADSDSERTATESRGRDPAQDITYLCRRLTVKWEPMFNMVHRYMLCRCVIRLSTPSKLEHNPEITFVEWAICPRHNNQGVNYRDYGDLVDNSTDPYFDKFGGYDAFRAAIAIDPKRKNHLGGDRFLPTSDYNSAFDAFMNSIPVTNDAWYQWELDNDRELHMHGFELPEERLRRVLEDRIPKRDIYGFDITVGDLERWRDSEGKDLAETMRNAPWAKEVREILRGEWDGVPHWEKDYEY